MLKHLLRRSSSVLVGFVLIVYSSSLLSAQSNCPDIQIIFDVPPVVCFDSNNSLIDLEVEVVGGDGTGTGQWSGQNITNTSAGFFRTTFAIPGQQKVYFTYTEGSCTYKDSTTFLYSKLAPPNFLASSEQAGHLCQDSFSILRVLSNYDKTNTNLVWDLAGGTAVEKGGPDSLHVNWTSPGSKLIQLQFEQYGCLSQPIIQQVVLDPVIDTPVVACDNTLESVVYEWEDPPNSSATVVFVISGPNGVADTIEDKYTIDDLMPGQFVQVRLVTTSENTCDGNYIEPICSSITCDGDLIDIEPIEKVCVSGGLTDTVDVNYILYDTLTPSTLTWSGAGVFDPTQPRIVVDPTMAGQTNWVYVEFQSATCTVRDSVSFELIPPPIADFTIPATTCEMEAITANFTFGPLGPDSDTTLIWDFGDATVTGDPATGTADLSWSTSGTKTVSLMMQVGACVSEPVFRFVNVQSAPEAAMIDCDAGPTSVRFSWQDISGATFDVRVIEGPNGTRISTTSYEVSGLSPNENVTIEVTTNGAGLCNTTTVTASCVPITCPEVTISIDPISPVCAGANPSPVSLTANISGGDGSGSLSWSGPGVSGSVWTPDASMAGQTVALYARFQEGNCSYEDSIQVEALEVPVADFDLDATTCITEPTTITANGSFPAGATFDWKINGVSDASLVGPGPHDLNWTTPGNQQIGLIITNGQCRSAQVTRTIQVQSALPEPVISCEAGIDQILFTWDPVPGALEYIVEVLEGDAGNRTSDTSIVFTGLAPGQTVEIAVILENSGACVDSRSEMSCMALGCHDVTVNIDRDLLPGSVFCIGEQDTSFLLDANVVSGIGTGTLVFSGDGVSDTDRRWTVGPAMAGQTYTITATYTEEGCTFSDAVDVTVQSQPTADFTVTSVVCPGEMATVTYTGRATANANFVWSLSNLTGPGPHEVTFDQAGIQNISLTVTESGCGSDFFEQSLEVLAPLSVPVITCENGLDEVRFSWAAGDATRQEVLYTGPGTGTRTSDTSFVITGLDPETAVSIEVQSMDDVFPCRNSSASASCSSGSCDNLSVNWTAPAAVCSGTPLEISFTTQGAGSGGFDVEIMQDGQTTSYSGITNGSTLSFDLSGNSTFSVTSAGLPGNATCAVNLPDPLSVTLDSPATSEPQSIFPDFCEGTDTLIQLSSLFTGSQAGGQWTFQSGPENPGSGFDISNGALLGGELAAGLYRFQYTTASANSCPDGTVDLEVNVLDSPVANAGPDLSLDCQFNIASLGSNLTTPGMNYQWSGPSGNALTDPNEAITDVSSAGSYTLLVTNPATGCSATDEVSVSASPGMISPYATIVPVSCYGSQDGMIIVDSILGGQAPYSFMLNGTDQGTRSAFGNLTAGSYDLQVSSSDGCNATLLLDIATPVELAVKLTTDLGADQASVTLGDSVNLTALINIPMEQIATINWLPNPGSGPGGSLSQMIYPLITSSYGVEITDVNGCKVSDRLLIVVNKYTNTFAPTAFSPNEDGNNDIFYLQSDHTVQQVIQFQVYNRWGKQVFANQNFAPNDPGAGWDGNTRSLAQPTGVYIYWAELELASGERVQISGDVALLR
ncbi:T9SS type B sorting domain-containing protein [Flavilitoribacter nigricans]|uniref:T9SS type B sorting domain-containing protein n=1 Tax=Flavilitoribacter nigricans TaxID=70997 RepID=UPI00147304D5|nr:gliding motility-associated C-terminal domain-containing protein [Flavilitoribacter nigricans]